MGRRPVCLVCLLFMGCYVLLYLAGFPPFRGDPLPEQVREQIIGREDAVVYGEIDACTGDDDSRTVYLRPAYVAVPDFCLDSEKNHDSEMHSGSECDAEPEVCSGGSSADFQLSSGKNLIEIYGVRTVLKEGRSFCAGDKLCLKGELVPIEGARNPGGFDYAGYYACKGVYFVLNEPKVLAWEKGGGGGSLLEKWKREMSAVLARCTGGEAPYFQAILLGERERLETEEKQKLQRAGLMHLLSVSGLHVGIIGMGLLQGLLWCGLGMVPSGMVSFLFLLLYGMLTGSSASTVRAVVVFIMNVGSRLLGRSFDLMTALAVSAILLLVECPQWMFQSSFLMSFSAVVGGGVIAPVLLEELDIQSGAARGIVRAVSVQMAMLPAVLWCYGEVAVWGFFLNLVLLPTAALVLVSGIGTVLLGGLWKTGGFLCALPGRLLLRIYDFLSNFIISLPHATWIPGAPAMWQVVIYFTTELAVLLFIHSLAPPIRPCSSPQKKPPGERKIVKGRAGGAKNLQPRMQQPLTVLSNLMRPANWLTTTVKGRVGGTKILRFRLPHPANWFTKNGSGRAGGAKNFPFRMLMLFIPIIFLIPIRPAELKITFLDVGQGDCAVLQLPDGKTLLSDCGSSSEKGVGTYALVPFLKHEGIDKLDGILISHGDHDHTSGILELLELKKNHLTGIEIGGFFLGKQQQTDEKLEKILALAEDLGIPVYWIESGNDLTIGETRLHFMAVPGAATQDEENEYSMVFEVEYGEFQGLFTGDIGFEAEELLLEQMHPVELLKVAHHGSRYSSGEEFLRVTEPKVAVVSCAERNSYGHPSPETVERIKSQGSSIFYTMESGAITIVTDGHTMKIHQFVAPPARPSTSVDSALSPRVYFNGKYAKYMVK